MLVCSTSISFGDCADCEHSGTCTKKVSDQCADCKADNQKQALDTFLAGLELIRKDQWPDALKQYEAAAAIETRFKAVYAKQAQLLKEQIQARTLLDKDQLTPEDVKTIRAIRGYCTLRNAPVPALHIAEKLHRRAPSNQSAELLAETQLLSAENQRAYDLLKTIKADDRSARGKLTMGIAAARLDKKREASEIASEFSLDTISPNLKYKYAALLAATGNTRESIAAIKSILDTACPFSSKRLRSQIAKSPDFAPLHSLPEFQAILQPSVPAAKTSSTKSSCANCPYRDKCAGGDKD